jgi:polyphosphate kinase
MGSADWMNRNLHSRIEVVFPIYDKRFGAELDHILQTQLNDTQKAVLVNMQLDNARVVNGKPGLAAQEAIYDYVKGMGI